MAGRPGSAHRPPLSVPSDTAITALSGLLSDEGERITRLWAKRLRAETYEVEVPGRDLREIGRASCRERVL